MKSPYLVALISALAVGTAHAASKDVTMNLVDADGVQKSVGQVSISETEHGLLFTPKLNDLPVEGMQGFHIHAKGSCEPAQDEGEMKAAHAAAGHFDPEATGAHKGPYGKGHLGDLPALYVNADGSAEQPVLAPRLRNLSQIEGRALMLHEGGDNYSDDPKPLGGGGKRIACGVI